MIARSRLLLVATLALLAACSGSVDPSPVVNDPTRVTVLPATATVFSGMPTTLVLSGGTGSYIVTSSNQAVIPIAGSVLSHSLIVIANPVIADTPVTLTVRDTGTAPLATATLTVRPGTLNNSITITPVPSNDPTNNPDCRPAVCTGGEAEVSVVLSQAGVPLPARGVRFDVVTGDFGFVNSPPGAPVTTAITVTTTTDETGRARGRIRTSALVPTQTATLQVTDIATGTFQRTSFTIAQFTGNPSVFFAVPQTVTFTGPRANVCASGLQAEFTVHGGTPPYTITGDSSAFSISPHTLSASGDRFTVSANGPCAPSPGLILGITDATGRTVTVTVVNQEGTGTAPPLVAAPSTATLTSCTEFANISVAGGVGPIRASANTGSLSVTTGSNSVSIQRVRNTVLPGTNPASPQSNPPVAPPTASPAIVSITDGQSTAQVQVYAQGAAAGTCP